MAFDDAPPERLWHYTDGAGAKGIITSRTLRAGHLGYMNDTSEVNHAMSVSLEVATRLLKEVPDHREALERWIRYLTDRPPMSWAPNVFAVSFSERRDVLSQWRGYATGFGGSFSLGFPSASIMKRCPPTWALRRCMYSREEQASVIEARMSRALQVSQEVHEAFGHEGKLVDVAFNHLRTGVLSIAPLCKHPDFEEEAEWRLYTGPIRIERGTKIGFNERKHTLSPFVEFGLSKEGGPLDDLVWIAGPGPQQERSNAALGFLAKSQGLTAYQGILSDTPYLP